MNLKELNRFVREHYPFPIAYAHKKTTAFLDDNMDKFKCLLETTEVTVQFLALLAVAQVRNDMLKNTVPQQGDLKKIVTLTNASFGRWYYLLKDAMKVYRHEQDQLIVPELFTFCFQETEQGKFVIQPVQTHVIKPLIDLRNTFHHGGFAETKIAEKVAEGMRLLHQLLEAIQFVARYQLAFTQNISVAEDEHQNTCFIHDLTMFQGCVSVFDRNRRQSAMHLKPGSVVFLQNGKHLILDPFIIFTNYIKEVPDLLLLNNVARNRPVYMSSQFHEKLSTGDKKWKKGQLFQDAMDTFFDTLQGLGGDAAAETVDIEESPLPEDSCVLSTAEVFEQKYRTIPSTVQHKSPYKFLDYYNPKDHDIFFGRDKEIRLLEQKFYNCRLLVLHGESGTGKTSLVRAGLIPRLSPESYTPVYVRVLQEPLREVKRELIRQLHLDEGRLEVLLAEFLKDVTERISKTVVIVLDQFEEFFLRFPENVRVQFQEELGACLATPRLDVKFLISLRADYFSYLAECEAAIPHIFDHQLQLERLTEAQALEAVTKPAERLGIQVDDPMVQIKLLPELLADEERIEPPLLQIVCDTLYHHAQSEERNTIGMADYEAIGDVKRVLGTYLETKLRQFGKREGIAKAVLKALVFAEGTKRASFASELLTRMQSTANVPVCQNEDELQQEYLAKFVRDRLLRVEEVEGRPRYELSHDYLATQIEVWIEESEREVTKILELIDRAYEAYQATGLLLETSALNLIKPYENQIVLPPDKENFVQRSKTHVRKQRRGLWLKVAAALMFVALVVGGIFGYQTYQAYQGTRQANQALQQQKDLADTKRKEAEAQQQRAEMNEIEALNQTSKALFLAHDELGALLAAIKAGIRVRTINATTILKYQTILNLRDVVYNIREKNRLKGVTPFSFHDVSFSPDGKLLASTSSGIGPGEIILWRVVDGAKLTTIDSMYSKFVNFSPDGRLLAFEDTVDERKVLKFWDVVQSKEIATLEKQTSVATSNEYDFMAIAFSPDGRWLASGFREKLESGSGDAIIQLWDLKNDREIATLHGHSSMIMSIAFSPDGRKLVSGSGDTEVKLWDVEKIRELVTLKGHSGSVNTFAFSQDGRRLASGSDDTTIKLWDVEKHREIATLEGHTQRVNSIVFSPDGRRLASGSDDTTIKLWDIETSQEIMTLSGQSEEVYRGVNCVAFSPDGKWLASGGSEQSIRLWAIANSQGWATFEGDSFSICPDGKQLALGGEDTVKLWDIKNGRQLKTFQGYYPARHSLDNNITFSSDGRVLASGSKDNTIRLWDVENGKTIATLYGHSERITMITFSPDGKWLASASVDEMIKLWDVKNRKNTATFYGDFYNVPPLIFASDGKWLASRVDGKIKFWTIPDGREFMTLQEFGSGFAIRSDGKTLASGGKDNTIRIWSIEDGKEIATLYGHSDEVTTFAFSPDGKLLASGSSSYFNNDHTIKLWDVENHSEIGTLRGHPDGVEHIEFSVDGKTLVSHGGNIILWNLDLDDLLVRGCQWLHGYLKNNPNVSDEDRAVCDSILESIHHIQASEEKTRS